MVGGFCRWNFRRARLVACAALIVVAGCVEDALHPPASGKATLVVAYVGAGNSLRADPDQVHIRVSRAAGVLYDSVHAFTASTGEVRVRVELELTQDEAVDVLIELLQAGTLLSRGGQSVTMKKGETTVASVLADNVADNLTMGDNFGCYLAAGGDAYCWGMMTLNGLGSSRPVAVAGGHKFVSIDAGGNHACGLTESGDALCWGMNTYGQLGNGTTADAPTPTPVSGGLKFRTISAGWIHTCGITTTGDLRCWGENRMGQLGVAGGNTSLPVAAGGSLRFDDVQSGFFSTCGLVVGDVYCWGWLYGSGTQGVYPTPNRVSGAGPFSRISVGLTQVCGITLSGAMQCWGGFAFSHGQLGSGTTAGSTTPVAVVGGHNFVALATPRANSIYASHTCGVTIDGSAYCWGNNRSGQLGAPANGSCSAGTGAFPCTGTPVAVGGGLRFNSIEMGNEVTCGMTRDGRVYCWGYGAYGALGTGSQTNSNAPSAVAPPSAAPTVQTIQITSRTLSLNVGDTSSISATVLDQRGEPVLGTVTWSSADSTRVRLGSSAGSRVLQAAAPGNVAVTASIGGRSATVNVSVSPSTIPVLTPQPCSSNFTSQNSVTPTQLEIHNFTNHPIRLAWIDAAGAEVDYGIIPAGAHVTQPTFLTHPWRIYYQLVVNPPCYGLYLPVAGSGRIIIMD